MGVPVVGRELVERQSSHRRGRPPIPHWSGWFAALAIAAGAHAAPAPMTLRQAELGAAAAGCSLDLVGNGWPARRVTVQVVHQNGSCAWRATPAGE